TRAPADHPDRGARRALPCGSRPAAARAGGLAGVRPRTARARARTPRTGAAAGRDRGAHEDRGRDARRRGPAGVGPASGRAVPGSGSAGVTGASGTAGVTGASGTAGVTGSLGCGTSAVVAEVVCMRTALPAPGPPGTAVARR